MACDLELVLFIAVAAVTLFTDPKIHKQLWRDYGPREGNEIFDRELAQGLTND